MYISKILNKYNFLVRYIPLSKSFTGKINFDSIDLLHFLYRSYKNFLQVSYNKKRINIGLQRIFNKIFPFYIYALDAYFEFLDYEVLLPFNTTTDCFNNGLTFFCTIKLEIKLILNYSILTERLEKIEKIYFSDIPMMTSNGTFIINGIEKVVISKFIRSPGILFLTKKKRNKLLYCIKLIPDKGYDLFFYINNDNIIYLNVKNKVILITTIFKALGYNNFDIINQFYNFEFIDIFDEKLYLRFNEKFFLNTSIPYDILDSDDNVIVFKNNVISEIDIENIKNLNIQHILVSDDYLLNRFLGDNIYYCNVLLYKISQKINKKILLNIKKFNIKDIKLVKFASDSHDSIMLTLNKDNINTTDAVASVNDYFKYIGFSIFDKSINSILNVGEEYYDKYIFDISYICRYKINLILNPLGYYNSSNNLNISDFIGISKLLIQFKDGLIKKDDLQSLDTLSLQLVANMVEDLIYDNLLNIKKTLILGRMRFKEDYFDLLPRNFLNFDLLNVSLKKFFNVSQFSQFLDQVNILSEISHKRRVSFLGIKGISRKHSGFDVRDLNSSYYSRICPVETPEGINIGLIGSLALFCEINNYGMLLSPYYKVKNCKVKNIIKYLDLKSEFNSIICDFNNIIYKNNIKRGFINARYNERLLNINSKFVNYIDIKPYQILSISACLIPFIEHNDSNRALMASNMLRQSLPCIYPKRPLIATGLEGLVSKGSDSLIFSKSNGVVVFVDSTLIILKKVIFLKNHIFNIYENYFLKKYHRSNQSTDISQRPLVRFNDLVKKGDLIADGSCTDLGELALGQNMLIAFMCFEGYNFEDSVIVSEKVVNDDKYTSLSINQLDISVYNTPYGPEVITKNIYNINSVNLSNLNDYGVIKLGSFIKGGDILLGKSTPISDTSDELSPEDRLVKSIFLEKTINEVDSSFYLPNNYTSGTVSNVEFYFSNNFNMSKLDNDILKDQVNFILSKKKQIFKNFLKRLKFELKKIFVDKKIKNGKFFGFINDDYTLKYIDIKKFCIKKLLSIKFHDEILSKLFKKFKKNFFNFLKLYKDFKFNVLNFKFKKNLPVNVLKIIRIHIISKKKLQVGDKMSGRHGNKGVVSKILPVNEMPYLSNGRTIDIILNPLGVSSRMNIGQILEVHLGLASFILGSRLTDLLLKNDINNLKKIISSIYNKKDIDLNDDDIVFISNFLKDGIFFGIPPFSSFKENDINNLLNIAFSDFDLEISSNNKQVYLYDGLTGKKFDKPITVGIMYFFKLNHLVDDKIHSRSIGPYSLVTQQPLKGRSNLGGQRLGEMEVWALEAYGASYTLQEMLTIKSDDVLGRYNAYKNIINGDLKFTFDRPESFDVMMNNVNALNLFISFRDC